MLLQFQYLLIAAILSSISIYMYLSLQILKDSQSANVFVHRITGVASFAVLITAAVILKGILLNIFLETEHVPKYQTIVSVIILVMVLVASVGLISHPKYSYYYSRRVYYFMVVAGFVVIIPMAYFEVMYYISTAAFLVMTGSFIFKSFMKLRMRKNIGLYFLIIASSTIVVAVGLSHFFEPLFFNTFNLALLTFFMLGFFIFFTSYFHEELNHKVLVLSEQEQLISRQNRELKEIIYRDDVVGIPNRYAFEEALSGKSAPCYVGLLNIRDFMNYNKLLGFDRGNQILKELAKKLRTIDADNTDVFRYYSDKFMIIFKTDHFMEATRSALKIQSCIESMKFQGVAIRTYMGLYYLNSEELKTSENCCTNLYGALETASSMARSSSSSIYH